MKKFLVVLAVVLGLAALAAPAAQAQLCMKWVSFCDGIQIDKIQNNNVTAQWYHYDCSNNTPMRGKIVPGHVPNDCAGGWGNGIIACTAADNCPIGEWWFVVDQIDGTLDMNEGAFPNYTCWIDQLAYTFSIGACSGAPGDATGPQVSTIQ